MAPRRRESTAPGELVWPVDESPDALDVARRNAVKHHLYAASFVHSSWFSALDDSLRGRIDLIVANPPYVGEAEADQVQLEVRKFEPRNAVFAGPTGLEVIERLIPEAHAVLAPGGWLVMEMSGTIADGVRPLLSNWSEVAIKNDLQGIARVVQAQKP